jgi:putative transposase
MAHQRRRYSAAFKFRVALEAVKGQKTMSELASEVGVHPTQINQWKRALLDQGTQLFSRHHEHDQQAQTAREAELYEQIGRLKMELEWLKKKVAALD